MTDNQGMDLDPPRQELLRLVADRQTDLATVSRRIGKNHAYLHQYVKQGKPRRLSEEIRELLGHHFMVNPDVFRPHEKMREMPRNKIERALEDGIMLPNTSVPEMDTHISTGGSDLMDDIHIIGRWQLPTDWLRSEIRTSDLSQIRILTLEGDSMEGTLAPGDKVIVDLTRRIPSPPGLFVIFDGLAQVAKRLEYLGGTVPAQVRVISDNVHYQPYDRILAEMSIVGRIMGRWQRLS